MDPRLQKWADVLVNYSLALKPGDYLVIDGYDTAAPLIRAVGRAALAAGAVVDTLVELDGLREDFLRRATDQQLRFVSPLQRVAHAECTAYLTIWGAPNTRSLSGIAPERLQARQRANRPVMDLFYERLNQGALRWCGTLFPTFGTAQEADLSLDEFTEFVLAAGHLNDPDPVASWRRIETEQQRLIDYLTGKNDFRIVAPGTDLRLSCAGRTWINCCGRVNFPDGEVFTAPVEGSVEGHIRFSFPGIYQGQAIEDIRLTFTGGRVSEASARTGEALLKSLLESDEGAKVPGEFAIGTNYNIVRPVREMLFDEKIGGTAHLALGRAFAESGGTNASAIHWDMLCDLREEGAIYADGEKFYERGRFLI